MSQTTNLRLPYIDPNQNQKSVTHNDALTALDALVNIAVQSATLTAPPASPGDGQRWIVASGATGAWTGHDGNLAAWQDGAWAFYPPGTGTLAFNVATATPLLWTGSAWTALGAALGALQLPGLGIGTAPDRGNPLVAKAGNILFAAPGASGGGDIRVKLNKDAAGNTASFLFQDGYAGRAEIGLTGDDDFHFKVSADGASWTDALHFDGASGGMVAAKLMGPIEASKNLFGNLPALPSDTVLRISGADGAQARLVFETFGPAATGNFIFRGAGGTALAPAALSVSARIGQFSAFGYGTTGYSQSARAQVAFVATESWTDGAQGTRVEVMTTPNGTLGNRTVLTIDQDGATHPALDNQFNLGAPSFRWSTIYAGSGTINTSDAREKTAVAPLTTAELAAAKVLAAEIGSFRFLDAIAAKGEGARTHVGLTVQRAMEILTEQGLDPLAYGFICHDAWDAQPGSEAVTGQDGEILQPAQPAIPPGDRYGFRTDELLLFLARGVEARLAALERRPAA